jgi:hypothetical protein
MADIERRTRLAVAALLVAALTGACQTKSQYAPSVPAEAGFRVENGVLKLWTGTPCNGVYGMTVYFDTDGQKSVRLEWRAPKPGVVLERMDLLKTAAEPASDTDAGLQLENPPPAGFDWTKANTLTLGLNGPTTSWGSVVDVVRLLRESPQHPAGSYLFGAIGWKDITDVQRENGRSFITICTPDPAREKRTRTAS